MGDYVHIFWECPKIQVYWQGVKREIRKVLGYDIPMHPVFFLLDGFPPDQFSKSHLFALHILLMAARKIITVNWMKVHQPTLTEWTQRLNQIYIFEKMTADLQLKSDIFQQTWALIETYLLGLWNVVGRAFFFIACDNLCLYLFICLFFFVNISSKCYVYIMFLTSLIKTVKKKKRINIYIYIYNL